MNDFTRLVIMREIILYDFPWIKKDATRKANGDTKDKRNASHERKQLLAGERIVSENLALTSGYGSLCFSRVDLRGRVDQLDTDFFPP
jgi:hypothetical protein